MVGIAAVLFVHSGPNTSLREAQDALKRGDTVTAIRLFEAFRKQPEVAEKANEGLATAYLKAKSYDQCISVCRQSAARWPGNPVFPHMYGLALFQAGELPLAEEKLKAAHSLAPGDSDIAYDFGLVLMAQQKYDLAAKQFESLIRKQDSALLRVLLGRAYLNSNRSVQAVQQFKAALRLDSKLPLAHYHLGFALESLGRLNEAIEELELESARQPQNPEVLYRLGHDLLEAGRTREAIDKLEKAIAGGGGAAYYDLGKALFMENRIAQALTALEHSIEINPHSSSAYFQLSRVYQKLGRKEAAAAALQHFYDLKKTETQSGGMATSRIP